MTDHGRPVFLIGYMCSGKTTLGRALARRLGTVFIDLDEEIEQRTGKTISQIFADHGEEYFRRTESAVLDDIIARHAGENVIVAVGGGTPCHGTNMDRMTASGLTVHLATSVDRLVERLKPGRATRPLVADKNTDELRRFVIESLVERMPHYDRAQAVFDSSRLEDANQINDSVERFVHIFLT